MLDFIIENLQQVLQNQIALIIFIIFLLWLGWRIRKAWRNLLFYFIKRRGKKGEYLAFRLLEKAGYEIIKEQNNLKGKLIIDDKVLEYTVKPDFLVKKNDIFYLAEVKTGDASNIKNISTRRQLLEYSFLMDLNTVILVDIQEKKIKEVDFKV